MSSKSCYHCGDDIIGKSYLLDEKEFCCNGCKSVYQLLSENGLDSFYTLEEQPGIRPTDSNNHKFAFLDVENIRKKFVAFEDESSIHITLSLPQIHCSSCIYLLENIHKIEPRIQSCQVNFAKRQASLVFSKELELSALANTLDAIGYAPNFGSKAEQKKKKNNKYIYKLGVAGFAFGSIMLWSFPEYLGIERDNPEFRSFTSYLSFAVSIPVLLYSANEYLISAYKAIRFRSLNLDVPISIGILALYFQSLYNIFTGIGPGYMDSFAGFIFFLLIGKWFQSKTYDSLSFERDYTAYFPVAVTRIEDNIENIVEIDQLKIGDELLIRNLEIIPCDATLESDEVKIDYSFVTGESTPVQKKKGDFIYAGGKLLGQKSKFIVEKESNRSHLTLLWNEAGTKDKKGSQPADKLSIFFLAAVLFIALGTGITWFFLDPTRLTEIVVSVLIVACPCALALSKPFTYGNTMRVLGRKGLYLKNTSVIEKLNSITDVVFDKTGTLTTGSANHVEYIGSELSQHQINAILVLANSSTHPLSKSIVSFLMETAQTNELEISAFNEIGGEGIEGIIDGIKIKIGSSNFAHPEAKTEVNETASHVSFDGNYHGKFVFESEFRAGILALLTELNDDSTIHVLSGDRDKDKSILETNVKGIKHLHFNQSPQDKFDYISKLQKSGSKVLMIGDGLNDSGALESADVGIAVSEDVFRFTPSSDAIIEASRLHQLKRFLHVSARSKTVLAACYIFSIVYNIIGLSFALTGHLTPLVAAIFMPLSSISIVLLSTLLVTLKK